MEMNIQFTESIRSGILKEEYFTEENWFRVNQIVDDMDGYFNENCKNDLGKYEIVREMGLENGAEWFAAVRMRLSSGKRLISELNPVYSDDKQLAWQIPDDEVSYNTLMEPNPVFIRE